MIFFLIIFIVILVLCFAGYLFYFLYKKFSLRQKKTKKNKKFFLWKKKKNYNSVDIDNYLTNEILVITQDAKIHHEINLVIHENYYSDPNDLSSKLIEWSNNNLIDFSALFTILNLYKNKFTYNIELWITSFVFFQVLKEIKISKWNYNFETFKSFGIKRMDYKSYDNFPKYGNALYFYNEEHFMYFGCFDVNDSKMHLVINVIKNLNVHFVPEIIKKLKILSNPLLSIFSKKVDINNIYNYISDTIYNSVINEINRYYKFIYDNYNNKFRNQTFNNNYHRNENNQSFENNKSNETHKQNDNNEFEYASIDDLKEMTFEESILVLNIDSKNPTMDEVKNAYKKMAKKFHPDVYKEGDSNKKMAIINKAYETLKASF